MTNDPIPNLIDAIDADRLRDCLFHLSDNPLPFRKLNHTRPGASKSSLHEADDFIAAQLEASGYAVEREGVEVQAFRTDESKPKASQYAAPEPEDPRYTAFNLYAEKRGVPKPDEIILFLAHKDSQSWVDSPGAYDNGVGTVAVMEIARVLATYESQRTIRYLFCNEEHRPWTSVAAAEGMRDRGDNLIAVFNIDSLGGKSSEAINAGLKTNVTLYTEPQGKRIAELVSRANDRYGIGLTQRIHERDRPGDDDGSFVNAGFPMAVANIGSIPYADPHYHRETDTPDRVDIENVRMATQLSLAAGVWIDRHGVDESK